MGKETRTGALLHQQHRLAMLGRILVVSGLICLFSSLPGYSAAEETELWNALRSGGHLVLLRHASAPGMGDPPEFRLGDCATQRNLSAGGRAQAVGIGELFRANRIQVAGVYSSQWCRCLETAELLGLGRVRELPALNSFFSNFQDQEPQTRMLQDWLKQQTLERPLVLVTHQVNITALTDVFPGSGELVVVRRGVDGELALVGTLETD